MPNSSERNQKITNFISKRNGNSQGNALKCPISPSNNTIEQATKRTNIETNPNLNSPTMSTQQTTQGLDSIEANTSIKQALGPLISEFRLLWESVETVHQDYADLKQTISKQKEDIKQDLTDKIEKNTSQLIEINKENKFLRKENNELKSRLDRIEQNQLTNNVILTGIPEGPYEQYSITKLRVQEMIAHTIGSGDVNDDLEKAKAIEITRCSRVGKFRHNNARPISITFGTKDDKEAFLSCKKKLPSGIFANDKLPQHIKRRRDRLMPIYRLAKSIPHYRDKSRLINDKLIIDGKTYQIENIANLPTDLAAYKAAEKSNETHIIFSGELSPYSNFHHSPFIINGQHFHSGEQWIQYQKAMTFGDSFTANQILQSETPLECKKLGYTINGVDKEKWSNIGYEKCFDGIREKFIQNPPLLSMLKTTTPKTLAEATQDRIWGTGIRLHDTGALDTEKWTGPGWLSRMLHTIRCELE